MSGSLCTRMQGAPGGDALAFTGIASGSRYDAEFYFAGGAGWASLVGGTRPFKRMYVTMFP
jgi:hypothetical protein